MSPTTLAAASSKEMQSRPLPMNRPGATPTSSLHSHSHSRNHSHSLSSGPALNAANRVSRRKSMTSSAANREAVVAVLKEAGSLPFSATLPISRSRAVSKSSRSGSPPNASQTPTPTMNRKPSPETQASSVIEDEPMLSGDEKSAILSKARIRRASDGQPLSKDGRKINRAELKCEQCGKGYKHSSCLTKHLWEHTPQWSYTSKLLISKHQQVQLLEAASVLVAMNNRTGDPSTPPDSAREYNVSDRESASPAASGYSDHRGAQSSTNTTPPPQSETLGFASRSVSVGGLGKGHGTGSGLTQSLLQEAGSGANIAASAPNNSIPFGHMRQLSLDQRPTSSGLSKTGRDDRDLAATLEMLSCSAGSNISRSAGVPSDAPPVPPLPAKYLDEVTMRTCFMSMGSYPTQPESFARGEYTRDNAKVDGIIEDQVEDGDFDMQSRARSDEDEDGIFGRMEE